MRLLLEPAGLELLRSLPAYDPERAVQLGAQLRAAGHNSDLVAAALTQQALRAQAEAKFGPFAQAMFFTRTSLQQATRLMVAARHAARYRAAGCTRVADLGCGLGSDAMALAGLGIEVDAVELDATTAALARLNLAPFPEARVVHGDALAFELSPYDGVYADPARRTGRGRVFDPAAYSPPLPAILQLRERVPALGVKVAPGVAHDALPPDVHAQWVSVGGDVVEAGLWFGPLASRPGRSALVMSTDGSATELETGTDPRSPAPAAPTMPLGRFLHEPDGAVIRAGGVAALAARLGAGVVSEGIAYLTSDQPAGTPLATSFEVLESFPYSVKRLSAWLAARNVGRLEIRKRGVDVVPDALRKKLRLAGDGSASVVLTRLQGRHSAVIVRRASPGGEG